MAMFLATRIMAGTMDYVAVFSRPTYKPFKTAVDDILVAEGREDLIKPVA